MPIAPAKTYHSDSTYSVLVARLYAYFATSNTIADSLCFFLLGFGAVSVATIPQSQPYVRCWHFLFPFKRTCAVSLSFASTIIHNYEIVTYNQKKKKINKQ